MLLIDDIITFSFFVRGDRQGVIEYYYIGG